MEKCNHNKIHEDMNNAKQDNRKVIVKTANEICPERHIERMKRSKHNQTDVHMNKETNQSNAKFLERYIHLNESDINVELIEQFLGFDYDFLDKILTHFELPIVEDKPLIKMTHVAKDCKLCAFRLRVKSITSECSKGMIKENKCPITLARMSCLALRALEIEIAKWQQTNCNFTQCLEVIGEYDYLLKEVELHAQSHLVK